MLVGLVCMNSKYALLLSDGIASYALSGAVRGQFALFAACLFPARLSRKPSTMQKTGKLGGVTRTDVRATPEEFFSIGDLSSGLEIDLEDFKNAFNLSLFQFLIGIVCQEGCIPKSCKFNAIQGPDGL